MKRPILYLIACLSLLLVAYPLFGQSQQILTLDAGAANWTVGVQPNTTNQLILTDNPDDFTEGTGSMQVNAKIRNFGASWGTWTDGWWIFSTPQNISQFDDIRFDMKIVTPPSHVGTRISDNRNIQFVIDLYDSVYYNGTGTPVLWRYAGGTGDMNIFYYPHNRWLPAGTGWFEVVIPFSALRTPSWAAHADGVWHGNYITQFHIGVDGDSSAADSVVFLMDNLRATKKTEVVQAQSCDGPASSWVVGTQPGANILATTADYPDDYIEGTGSLEATTAIRTQAASWGSWTDYSYSYAPPLNAMGATELRFSYKTLVPTKAPKRLQFVVDLYDSRGGPWRWANGFGQFGLFAPGLENNAFPSWTEVVIPLLDLQVPSWAASDTYIHLDSLTSLHFGVDADSSGADSTQFLLDNFYFTKLSGAGAVGPTPGVVPSQFRLDQNYPNPFNPATRISFQTAEMGKISLKIYNVNGQLVLTALNNADYAPGTHQVDVNMSRFSSGAYFYVLEQGTQRLSKMMMLVK